MIGCILYAQPAAKEPDLYRHVFGFLTYVVYLRTYSSPVAGKNVGPRFHAVRVINDAAGG